MTQTLYELKGRSFTAADREYLLSTIRRDFYTADCNIVQESEDLYFCNSRSFAGYIPISRHCTAGIRTVTRRTLQEVRHNSSDTFLIWMPIRGAVTITQNGRTATIEPGSFALCYSNEPFCVGTLPGAEHDHLSFQITAPAHLVSRAIPEPKRLCAVPFSTSRAGARIARDLLLSLYEEAEHLDRGSAEALALSALNALFRTIDQEGSELGRSMGVREVKLQRLMDYLELNYSDSELTTETVAKACGISPRYLHYLLKSKGIRFCDYLWQARLNNAYKQLTDTALWRRSISEIAYAIGFKSSAHFSRAFRNQFGQAPREVRQQALADRDIVPRPEIRGPALWLHDDQADKLSPALIASPDLMWPALIN
jgi:AraC family transcriptional activator of tynA and feaB